MEGELSGCSFGNFREAIGAFASPYPGELKDFASCADGRSGFPTCAIGAPALSSPGAGEQAPGECAPYE